MKSIFSLDWFKSQRQIDLENLKNKEQELKNKLLEKQLNTTENSSTVDIIEPEKPYVSLNLINNVLTVKLNGGAILSKSDATSDDFYSVKRAISEEDILSVMMCSEYKKDKDKIDAEVKKAESLSKGIKSLERFKDFTVKENSVYIDGIERSVPQLLVERFLQITHGYKTQKELKKDKEYLSLKKFWLKCCANPNAQSAEDLYVFLTHHQFKIDRHGNFYAYRRVVSKRGQDNDLVDFISNAYNKVKAIWKKNPDNYMVYSRLSEYQIVPTNKQPTGNNPYWEKVGNLKELYLDLPNMAANSYTSAHTGKEDYKVGSVISMPRQEGDDNNNVSCSKGFHAASKAYDYSGFGDTPILVIINPIDVLSVPVGEVGKLRTCRWFFAMTLTEEEEHILDDQEFDVEDLGDVFEEQCSQNLQEYIHQSFAEEVQRHTFKMPEMSHVEIKKIVKSLDQIKNEINNRVQKIV